MNTLISTILLFLVKIIGLSTATIPNTTALPTGQVAITAFAENDKTIFIGTNVGLILQNKLTGRITPLTQKKSSLPSDHITSIACTRNGQVYIGTQNGILLWDQSIYLPLTSDNSNIPDNHVTALAVDQDEYLWIGTQDEGLVKSTGDPVKPYRTQPILFNNESIYSITTDSKGGVWVALQNGSFACLRNGKWESYDSPEFIEKIQPGPADRFIFNTSDLETYVCEGRSCEKIKMDATIHKKIGAYYSTQYSRFLLFFSDGVYVFDYHNPFSVPEIITSASFIDSFYPSAKMLSQK